MKHFVIGTAVVAVILVVTGALVATTSPRPVAQTNPTIDSDGDGIENILDACPGTVSGMTTDEVGCSNDQNGFVSGHGSSFTLGSVTVSTSSPVDVALFEAQASSVNFTVGPNAGSADITISGLHANTTYYRYADGQSVSAEMTSSGSGEITFAMDVDTNHSIALQDFPSSVTLDGFTVPAGWTGTPTAPVGPASVPTTLFVTGNNLNVDLQTNGTTITGAGLGTGMIISGSNNTINGGTLDNWGTCAQIAAGPAGNTFNNSVCNNPTSNGFFISGVNTNLNNVTTTGATFNGALFFNAAGSKVDGGTYTGNGTGVRLQGGVNMFVQNNVVAQSNDIGAWVSSTGSIVVDGLNSTSNNLYNLGISNVLPITVSNSVLDGSLTFYGLFVSSSNVIMSNTSVSGNGDHGIHVLGTGALNITDSTIDNNGNLGISLQGGTSNISGASSKTQINNNSAGGVHCKSTATAMVVGPDVESDNPLAPFDFKFDGACVDSLAAPVACNTAIDNSPPSTFTCSQTPPLGGGIADSDGDGIEDSVDVQPGVVSTAFENGTLSGDITEGDAGLDIQITADGTDSVLFEVVSGTAAADGSSVTTNGDAVTRLVETGDKAKLTSANDAGGNATRVKAVSSSQQISTSMNYGLQRIRTDIKTNDELKLQRVFK